LKIESVVTHHDDLNRPDTKHDQSYRALQRKTQMINNNTRLLVAIDANTRFPKDFRDYIEKSTLKTDAQVIQKKISDGGVEGGSTPNRKNLAEHSGERPNTVKRNGDFALPKTDYAPSQSKMIDPADISLEDLIWANSYLIVAPVYHTMASLRLERFLETFSDPTIRQHLRRKTVSAMTLSSEADEHHIDVLQRIYVAFLSYGSIIVPAGLCEESAVALPENAFGYRHVVGRKVEEEIVDRQIQRLVDITNAVYSHTRADGVFQSANNL